MILAASIAVSALVLVLAARTLRTISIATHRLRQRHDEELRASAARLEDAARTPRDREPRPPAPP